jgi:hypothetical protein
MWKRLWRRVKKQYAIDEEGRLTFLPKDSKPVLRFTKLLTNRVAVTQLIGILRAGIYAKTLEVSFNYFALYRVCWRLLRKVKNACEGKPVSMYSANYFEER